MSEVKQNSNNTEEISAYRSIFKATSLFGGVQLWKILIEIVKQKFIAILLGPTGMGIRGLYISTTQLIQGLTAMGLSSSAVKNIAEANGSGDFQKISRVVIVLRRLVWFTGLLGMIVVIAFSPILSKSTFGNYDYTIPFIFLSVTLLFQQLSAGQSVILQGMRKLKHLAKSGVLGSFFGLIISIPIYYFFGIKGIVPTLILNSITTLLLTWYFSKKIKIEKQKITPKQTFQEGKEMLKMGLAMSLTNILVLGIGYIIRIYIVRIGGTEEVGLFTAGFAIVNGYVGLIFTAMGTDYYPRLAGVNKDNQKCKEIINQQAEVAILILAPIIMIFLLTAPYAVSLLYSNKFVPITGYMQWAMLGMIFKATSWSISFIFVAKQDMKIFLLNEISIKIFNVPLYLLMYKYFGLDGLGIGFMINYFVYFILMYFVSNRKYKFRFVPSFNRLFFICTFLVLLCFILIYLWKSNYVYIPTIILTLICCMYSLKEVDRRMKLKSIICKFRNSST
ncbi:MAG: O-antigen translocase [Lentimicrobiaceae bacterium]|nr:O-antigen translocase [Lentimicrobiaceae bacterium]